MKYIYYTKEGKFETDDYSFIPFEKLYSPNEETPALIYPNGAKVWYFEGKRHRLTGPAVILDDKKWFYIYGKYYTFKDWLEIHPNKDKVFQAFMKLKYS